MGYVAACLWLSWVSITTAYMMPTNEMMVKKFVESSLLSSIDQECKNELKRLSLQTNLETSVNGYLPPIFSSYSVGRSDEFMSETRWLHNMLKCFWSNREFNNTRSFCYGYDSRSKEDMRAMAICVPRCCADDKFELLEKWSLISTNGPLSIDYAHCTHSRHERPWYLGFAPLSQLCMSAFFTTIITLGTVYDSEFATSGSVFAQLLYAFSLKRNCRRLVKLPKDPHSTITCMFGLRFISMIWTLIGHSFSWIQAYIGNVEDFRNHMSDNFWNLPITNFNLGVDTFFVLSATLTAYAWFRNVASKRCDPRWNSWSHWLSFYRHRLVRLWPAYLLALSSITFFFTELHSHPMWPPSDPSIQCRKHGWQNVFFINSLMGNKCMGWTWYIGTELMYYFLSPIFLLALRRSLQFGLMLGVGIIGLSCSFKIRIMSQKNYPPIPLLFRDSDAFSGTFMEQMDDYYIKPQYRISPYIIGLLLGYGLAVIQTKAQEPRRSSVLKYFGWFSCICLGCWSIFGAYPTMKGLNVPVITLLYGATHRISWALSVAWIIYACHTGIGGFVNKILSLNFLIPLSSLCYSVYLMHLLVVFGTFMWSPFPMEFTGKFPILLLSIPQLLLSYLAAMTVSMYIEFPALNIEKLILKGTKTAKVESAEERKEKLSSDESDEFEEDNNNDKDENNNYVPDDLVDTTKCTC